MRINHSAALSAFLLAGCSAPPPYQQVVVGTLSRGGVPAAAVPIRFVLSPSAEARPCSPSIAEVETNRAGQFSFTAQYVPSKMENYAVLVQHHAVCAQVEGQWSPIWEFTTGPAMSNINLRCIQNEGGKVACEQSAAQLGSPPDAAR
jgi:hypothetical protein